MNEDDRTGIATVNEAVRGLRAVTENGFRDVQRQLNLLEPLPVRVEGISKEQAAHEKRIAALESNEQRGSEWRRGQLPTIVISLALVLVGVATILAQVH